MSMRHNYYSGRYSVRYGAYIGLQSVKADDSWSLNRANLRGPHFVWLNRRQSKFTAL